MDAYRAVDLRAALRHTAPMIGQEPTQLLIGNSVQTGPREHHQVQTGEFRAVNPKALPYHPLYAVAADGPSYSTARDRHPEPGPATTVPAREHLQSVTGEAHRLCEHPPEVPGSRDPAGTGKRSGQPGGRRAETQALNLRRRLARRFLMILRPAFVAMRARNPWRRLRFRLLG